MSKISLMAVALASSLFLSEPGGAQTATELSQQVAAMRDSVKATQRRLSALQDGQALALDDSVVVDGVTVFFPRTVLSERDRATLREGIANAIGSLNDRFGVGARRLFDGDVWSVTSRRGSPTDAYFSGGREPIAQAGSGNHRLPLRLESVERFVNRRASQRMLQRNPVLDAWAGRVFSFREDEEALYVARRQLATSKSSVARRCASGTMGACRTILDPRAAEQWFAPVDSAHSNARPIPAGVKGTVVTVAMELGGARAVDALFTPSTSEEPLQILADAAGVTADSLLLAWSARLSAAGDTSATPSLPFAASAFFWSGLLLLAATRRRPR